MEFFAQAGGKYAAVSTNPYVYEAGTPSYIFIALCVLEFLFKIIFSILLMTNDDFQNCSAPWIYIGSFVTSFYFLLFVFSNRDLTINRRYSPFRLFLQPVLYIAILNILAKIYVSYDLTKCIAPPGTDTFSLDVTSWSGWMILLILASVAIDGGLLWIGTHYAVQTYDPNKGNFMFKKTRTFEERDNLSPEPFNEKTIEIKRKVGGVKQDDSADAANPPAKHQSFPDKVKFTIKLDQPINPGHMVSVIPETHNELGAIKVNGYRAFAPQVDEVVQTRIKAGKKLLSRLHENYARIVELDVPVPPVALPHAAEGRGK